MQLQPQLLSYLRFNAPQYQYKPSQQAKINEKKYLEMYYKTNPDTCFVQLVETLFSDRYLYQHKNFRQLVEENKKGFVNIDVIFKQELTQKFLKQMGDQKIQKREVIQLIKRLSTKLFCNRTQVRRKFPFINKLKLSKPLYLQEYPQNDGNQELQTLLENTTNVYKIKYKHSENWAMVYVQDPDKVKKLNGHFWSIKTYLRVISNQKAKELFSNSFQNDGWELKNLYQKSIFQQSQQNRMCNCMNRNYSDEQVNNEQNLNENKNESPYDEMFDEQQSRIDMMKQRLIRDRNRNDCVRQRGMSLKQRQERQLFQPNQIFNGGYFGNNVQSEDFNDKKQRRLSELREKQIDDILLRFFEEETISLISNKNSNYKNINMQLQ